MGFIRKVDKFNEKYLLRDEGAVLNWFDITEVSGHLSVKDRLSDIMATEEGAKIVDELLHDGQKGDTGGFELNDTMRDMMGGFTLLRLSGMLGTLGIKIEKEQLLKINGELNKIKKKA